MIKDQFVQDSVALKNELLVYGRQLADEIDKLERSSDSHMTYYGYLKDFLINSGCLCDDVLQASANDAVLLAMIGTRVLLEDTINVHYLEVAKSTDAERMALAEEWLKLSNDKHAQKNELDGKSVADRAKAAGKDVRQLYYNEYAMFCNYTHSSAIRGILNSSEHRSLGAKKAILASLQAYANIVTCITRLTNEEKSEELAATANAYFSVYQETVARSTLPLPGDV